MNLNAKTFKNNLISHLYLEFNPEITFCLNFSFSSVGPSHVSTVSGFAQNTEMFLSCSRLVRLVPSCSACMFSIPSITYSAFCCNSASVASLLYKSTINFPNIVHFNILMVVSVYMGDIYVTHLLHHHSHFQQNQD